jgi:glycogen debranching enzyme
MESDKPVISAGSVFAISSANGDIHRRTTEGLYAHDTRFLSTFRVLVAGHPLDSTGFSLFNHSMASFYGVNRAAQGLPAGSISVVRDRYVGEGLHEDISIGNHSGNAHTLRLEVTLDSDFADIFQVRLGNIRKVGHITLAERESQDISLVYQRDSFRRETWVSFSEKPSMQERTAVFNLTLAPKETWKTCITVLPVAETAPRPMPCIEPVLGSPFGDGFTTERIPLPILPANAKLPHSGQLPVLETDHHALQLAYQQALADLAALDIEYQPGLHILAAGIPWFMAVFGRDSIISAIQTKLLGPDLMLGTLHILASLQAKEGDTFREADPGKILHEVRVGELSLMEEVPHSQYYGTIDATPLFLILLWEAYQWTGSGDLLLRFLPAAEAALRWIDRYGDQDGDGFVEYRRRTRHGLRNQGWKDSGDCIASVDGVLAQGPIALAEVQGYVYDAKRKMADIYRVLGRIGQAQALEWEASELRSQFEEAFWMPEEGFYALALDGRKQQVNSISSNPGHCLWSGIVRQERARQVVERLMAPDMFSGWGIRTLSSEMAHYNPLSYHNGSVWPHDNSIIAAGIARYGFTEEARRLALTMAEAAVAFPQHRLPELFSGYSRRTYSFPVPYPAANSPQAWASGSVIYLLETLLGVAPAGERLLLEATREGLSITLNGVPYRGTRRVL